MESYPVDIDPDQIVRWVKAEHDAAPSTFKIAARRSREVRELPVRSEVHLGDQEREDLSEIATIATLEIAPAHAGDGWLLSVVVEDEVGPGVPDTGSSGDTEETIDLGTFYNEFTRRGRGNANVVAEVEGPLGKEHFARLLSAIENNRHGAGSAATKR